MNWERKILSAPSLSLSPFPLLQGEVVKLKMRGQVGRNRPQVDTEKWREFSGIRRPESSSATW